MQGGGLGLLADTPTRKRVLTFARISGTLIAMTSTDRIAGNIRSAINQAGITMNGLSKATGIARSTLTEQINGDVKLSVDTLVKVAEALNVEPAELFVNRRGRLPGPIGGRRAA